MSLEEIVNKAIPISFPGVKCAATLNVEKEKALLRREQLTKDITTLLQTAKNVNISSGKVGVDGRAY
jgi:hypothetical protein